MAALTSDTEGSMLIINRYGSISTFPGAFYPVYMRSLWTNIGG
jgi:hypothetical protein